MPRSLVRERYVRPAPPHLKLEYRKCLSAIIMRLCRGISVGIFEVSRMNALALIIPAEVAISEVARLETDRGHRQRGVRREVHARGLAARGDQTGAQGGNHRAVVGAQGELRND